MGVHLTGAPYKAPTGQWLLKALFHEPSVRLPVDERVYNPVFSLDNDIKGLINARATYVELMDPTGFKWAMQYLNSWEHYERLLGCSWFLAEVEAWNREIKMTLQMRAIEKIREIAKGDSPQAYQAAKYLATADWEKGLHKAGRPSREVIKGELAQAIRQASQTEEDAARIGLTLIKGGRTSD